ncbi:hypothetical protein HBB16_12030, partial [Pseudonocardia sp. MCCB 268]|nr:hypothetical protein [Pseudonocardia cytotoxica]
MLSALNPRPTSRGCSALVERPAPGELGRRVLVPVLAIACCSRYWASAGSSAGPG